MSHKVGQGERICIDSDKVEDGDEIAILVVLISKSRHVIAQGICAKRYMANSDDL